MAVVTRDTDVNPKYTALSTDIADNKITGASSHGDIIYLTDTKTYKIIEADTTLSDFIIAIPTESNGAVPVNIQDQHSEPVCLYLHDHSIEPTLTSDIAVDDVVFDIDDNTGLVNGYAITLHEGANFYQGIVISSTATTVTVSTPSDRIFTAAGTAIHSGSWNAAVDGSGTPQVFSIHPPPGADFDIYTITISALSETEMDATTFLGIADGITNGTLLRVVDGDIKNLGLFVNNLGFEEFGYSLYFPPVNKKSEYGMIARKNMSEVNGVSIRLEGATEDSIELTIRDDLDSESLFAVIMKGHVVTD